MYAYGLKIHLIRILSSLLVAMCLLSKVSHGKDEMNSLSPSTPSTTQTSKNPPSIEQTLVPESVFAMQLAEALKLGQVPNEAKAEELLSGLGIEPKNGWIADYPVTPAVLGDVEKGIAMASDQGKIALTKGQALKLVGDIKAKLGFDVNPGQNAPAGLIKKPVNMTIYSYTDKNGEVHFTDDYDSIPKEYLKNTKIISQLALHKLSGETNGGTTQSFAPQYKANRSPEVIDKYYDTQGPPVVTYYSPPEPYDYLYSWVPYPFWSTGYYFPGYFVLNNFRQQVVFNRHPYFVSHHGGNGDFQRPPSAGSINRDRTKNLSPDEMAHSRRFSSPHAQAGAREIHSRNRSINGSEASRMDGSRRPFVSSGNSGNYSNTRVGPNGRVTIQNDTPYSGGETFNQPALRQPYSSGGNFRNYGTPPVVPNGRITIQNDMYRPMIMQDDMYRPTPNYGGFNRGGSSDGFHGDNGSQGHGGFSGGAPRGGRR
jgi:hypothetical protein